MKVNDSELWCLPNSWMSRLVTVVFVAAASFTIDGHFAEADPTAPKYRPTVIAILSNGLKVEGLLERFDDGRYWILVAGKQQTFAEQDLVSIQFRVPAFDTSATVGDPKTAELIRRFFQPTRNAETERRYADPTVMLELAAVGPMAVRPLLAAYRKQDDDYQSVGKVLQQMGPAVFPLLVECVREDPGRSARFPVWYALCKGGVEHADFIRTLLKDKDPRIRLLAMEVLYSWSITSGTVLPKTLDLPLIRIMSDPDKDVRWQAPLILGRIGFNSDLVLPALLRTMEDDKYAVVRSNSVIALGYLGKDLKNSDPDLTRIVTVLSRAVTDDGSENIRSYAAFYLGEMGPKAAAALPALERATDDKKEIVRTNADEAILKVRRIE